MIDYFTLALTHGLIAVALWRLLFRPELDQEDADPRSAPRRVWSRRVRRNAADQPGEGNA